MAAPNNPKDPLPMGEPFARLYLERGAPAQDNEFFRNRLAAYIRAEHHKDYAELHSLLQRESGLIVPTSWQINSVYYDYPKFFRETQIAYLLSAITFIWRFLRDKYPEWTENTKTRSLGDLGNLIYPKADAWRAFVARAMREENMAYRLDEKCGVHYFVDEEFEHNRLATLKCLGQPRYSAVKDAFQAAHAKLEQVPADTKSAIRDTFEAIETLTKVISDSGKSLTSAFVIGDFGAQIQRLYAKDVVAQRVAAKAASSFADWVDAAHPYRHGQQAEEPIAPPLELAVLLVSQGASFIRWLIDIDALLLV